MESCKALHFCIFDINYSDLSETRTHPHTHTHTPTPTPTHPHPHTHTPTPTQTLAYYGIELVTAANVS
jgi:hypothetical protein